MTVQEIKELIKSSEYDFLRNNEHLGDNISIITVGGSHAYGTNTDSSDVDIRGMFLPKVEEVIGFGKYETFTNDDTDTCLYSFRKFVELLYHGNSSALDVIGSKPEYILYLDDVGRQILDNSSIFLSKSLIRSLGGFANKELRWLFLKLSGNKDNITQVQLEENAKRALGYAVGGLAQFVKDYGNIDFHLEDSDRDGFDKEILVSTELKNYPIREFNHLLSGLRDIVNSYDRLKETKKPRNDKKVNKHAMHTVRIYAMGIELLEDGVVRTYREKEHELLMDIRNGKYLKEDGSYDESYFDIVNDYRNRFDLACKHTVLPDKPDYKRIEELVMSVNKKVVLGYV